MLALIGSGAGGLVWGWLLGRPRSRGALGPATVGLLLFAVESVTFGAVLGPIAVGLTAGVAALIRARWTAWLRERQGARAEGLPA